MAKIKIGTIKEKDINVDKVLSDTSENPVQNKAITGELNNVKQSVGSLEQSVSGKVSKSGDTMTGPLDAPSVQVNGEEVYSPSNPQLYAHSISVRWKSFANPDTSTTVFMTVYIPRAQPFSDIFEAFDYIKDMLKVTYFPACGFSYDDEDGRQAVSFIEYSQKGVAVVHRSDLNTQRWSSTPESFEDRVGKIQNA